MEVNGTAVNVAGVINEANDALTCTDITTPVAAAGPLNCNLGFFYVTVPYVATYVNQ